MPNISSKFFSELSGFVKKNPRYSFSSSFMEEYDQHIEEIEYKERVSELKSSDFCFSVVSSPNHTWISIGEVNSTESMMYDWVNDEAKVEFIDAIMKEMKFKFVDEHVVEYEEEICPDRIRHLFLGHGFVNEYGY